MLKTREELNRELGKITERDREKLESIVTIIQDSIKKEQITEELIFQLGYMSDLLRSLSTDYCKRLIVTLKQGWIISA